MADRDYTVHEIIDYFEGQTDERFDSETERFASGNAQNARVYRDLMGECRSVHNDTFATAQSDGGQLGVTPDGRSKDLASAHRDCSAELQEAQIEAINAISDKEDQIEHATRDVTDDIVYGERVTGVSSDADVETSDARLQHISGVKGGIVDNSTVVGVVKGGMRNKQTVVDSDICITGSRGQPDGDDEDTDGQMKDVAGVPGGVVKDSTVVGEVHGGMDNEQTIENSKIYSDGRFGGNLQFLDLNIRQREDCGEHQDGAVQSFKDCIIDLRKPDDVPNKDKTSDDAEFIQNQTGSAPAGLSAEEPDKQIDEAESDQGQIGSASSVSENSAKETDDVTDTQDMQEKIQEVAERSEREEEDRRLLQERQTAMEQQMLNDQRERQWMQNEMQRIAYEQQRRAAYGGYPTQVPFQQYPPPVVINPVVAPAAPRVVYVKTQQSRPTGSGLRENVKQFFKGRKQ